MDLCIPSSTWEGGVVVVVVVGTKVQCGGDGW